MLLCCRVSRPTHKGAAAMAMALLPSCCGPHVYIPPMARSFVRLTANRESWFIFVVQWSRTKRNKSEERWADAIRVVPR